MKVTVKLFATLRVNRQNIQELELQEGAAPQQVAQLLGIPVAEIAIVMINGRGVAFDTPCRIRMSWPCSRRWAAAEACG